jgi:hypothetical protein
MSATNYSRVLAASIQQGAKDSGLSLDAYLEREEQRVESVAAMRRSAAREQLERKWLTEYCARINAATGQLDSEESAAVKSHLSEITHE